MTAKQNPCTECFAQGREAHAPHCSIGIARSAAARKNQANRNKVKAKAKTKTKAKRRVPVSVGGGASAPEPVVQVNRIALIVDRSGSMGHIHSASIKALNSQIATIKAEALNTGQPTYVSVYDFGNDVRCVYRNEYVHAISEVTARDIRIAGMTAMMDAVGAAAEDFESLADSNDPNVSFLLMVLTDGMENASHRYSRRSFITLMNRLNATDRWTFVFSGPRDSRSYLEQLGVHPGNIQEWDQTNQGIEQMAFTSSVGVGSYMAARSAGKTSVKSIFVDMSNVKDSDIKRMQNVSSTFKVLKIDNAGAGGIEWLISDFVEDRIARNKTLQRQVGDKYAAGLAYYQLTKSEKVQPSKDLAVRDKLTGKIYGGHEARALIGIPTNEHVRVTPRNVGNYDIFIRSTSVNRKLVRGTDLLYRVK